MEGIQRHTDCDNFQKPECPHYDNEMMNEAYLVKEGATDSSRNILIRIDNELCKNCDEFTPKT